jgi:hypothetical protein
VLFDVTRQPGRRSGGREFLAAAQNDTACRVGGQSLRIAAIFGLSSFCNFVLLGITARISEVQVLFDVIASRLAVLEGEVLRCGSE